MRDEARSLTIVPIAVSTMAPAIKAKSIVSASRNQHSMARGAIAPRMESYSQRCS
ncbi:MAG: hypothetical protein F6K04_22560 [Leptolyngbya sp. SIO4C5]|nr:hypothetical protein [Leptolyngbya sp. SIO4C5]